MNVEGVIRPGDTIVAIDEPSHGFTMGEAFAAWMGDDALARQMWELDILPPLYQERYEKRFGGRTARVERNEDGFLVAYGSTEVTDADVFALIDAGRK